jgi:hypothetical protein
MNRMIFFVLLVVMLSPFTGTSWSQSIEKEPPVYVDQDGVMRWSSNDREVSLFGVNYSVPFAHGYRAVKHAGVSHEKSIDEDVYHFARMGLDAYRIHVWDIEISDTKGNLLENDHLRLLDYLIMRLKERGIKIVLTPMRNADNVHPESNDVLGWGFSRIWPKYGNVAHHTPEAVAAQQRFVGQFINHVNPFTGISYKDDPDIIAFEINNEPHHINNVQEVKEYVNSMVKAMRETGMNKPVFYNMSHNFGVTEAFLTADIQGGTFQWYPTGLNAGFTQKGNFLPNVNRYTIPFNDHPAFRNKARLVYEFCPSDVMDNYLYPAMARTFRQNGFQFMAHFAYDAMAVARFNSEYKTHFLNLAYTPAKGISMKIAGEVARRTERNSDFGNYPENNRFGPFRVSYEEDLAEMITDEAFFYTNHTSTHPSRPGSLAHLAGVGSSSIVNYEGTGAYFLDRLEPGTWRLEVMPDVIALSDPFDDPSFEKEVSRIVWNVWPMTINLPDLGENFRFRGINAENTLAGRADGLTLRIGPGVYILTRDGVSVDKWTGREKYGNIKVGEFAAPAPEENMDFMVVHTPFRVAEAGKPLVIKVDVTGPRWPESVAVYFQTADFGMPVPSPTMKAYVPMVLPMKRSSGYSFEAVIPDTLLKAGGGIMYHIVVETGSGSLTWPGAFSGKPGTWDYYHNDYWGMRIVAPDAPVLLMEAREDFNNILPLTTTGRIVPQKHLAEGSHLTASAVRIDFRLNDNLLFLREFVGDKVAPRKESLPKFTYVVVRAKPLNQETRRLQFGLLTTDGYTYATPFELKPGWQDIRIPLKSLRQTNTALRLTYPQMMDEYFIPVKEIPFDISKMENWEISTGELFRTGNLSFAVECIWLE